MRRLGRAIRVGFVFLLCGCAAGVSRYGYVMEPAQVGRACDVDIKRDFRVSDHEMTTLGNIDIHDGYMSAQCNEASVFRVVIADACGLGADIINVTEEKQPDYVWISCYRVRAQFLRFVDREQAHSVESDPHYELSAIQQRGEIGKQRANRAYAMGVAVGIVSGLIAGAMAGSAAGSK